MKKSKTPTRAEKHWDTLNLSKKVEMLKKHCGWNGGKSLSIEKHHKEKIYREEILNKSKVQ